MHDSKISPTQTNTMLKFSELSNHFLMPPSYQYKDRILVGRILIAFTKYRMLSTKKIAEDISDNKAGYGHKKTKTSLDRLKEIGYCLKYTLVINQNHVCESCKSNRFLMSADYLDYVIENHFDNTRPKYILGNHLSLKCFNCKKFVNPQKESKYKISTYTYWTITNTGLLVLLANFSLSKNPNLVRLYSDDDIFELVNVLNASNDKIYLPQLQSRLQTAVKFEFDLYKTAREWFEDTRLKISWQNTNEKKTPLISQYKEKRRRELMFANADYLNQQMRKY
jgi:hypothetical protein